MSNIKWGHSYSPIGECSSFQGHTNVPQVLCTCSFHMRTEQHCRGGMCGPGPVLLASSPGAHMMWDTLGHHLALTSAWPRRAWLRFCGATLDWREREADGYVHPSLSLAGKDLRNLSWGSQKIPGEGTPLTYSGIHQRILIFWPLPPPPLHSCCLELSLLMNEYISSLCGRSPRVCCFSLSVQGFPPVRCRWGRHIDDQVLSHPLSLRSFVLADPRQSYTKLSYMSATYLCDQPLTQNPGHQDSGELPGVGNTLCVMSHMLLGKLVKHCPPDSTGRG